VYFYAFFIISIFLCSELKADILNGSFTNGSQNWITQQNFYCTNSGYSGYRTAPGYAWFASSTGQPANSIWGTLTQSFIMPSSFSSASINFYTSITTDEITTTTAYDKMTCTVTDGSTQEVSQITLSNLDASSGYVGRTIPIPATMAGHTLTLTFYAQNDAAKPTVFRVDDVSLNITTNSLPDLTITAGTQTVTSSNIKAGSNIEVSCSEDNSGSVSAGSNNVGIYLSKDATLTPGNNGDIFLGNISFPSISPNSNSIVYSNNLIIPSSISQGNYYLFFWADGDQVINESDENNNFASIPIFVTDVKKEASGNIPKSYNLYQNFPNPFNPITVIKYDLPYESTVKLNICNAVGKVVKELINAKQASGNYEVNFEAGNLPSGIYIYTIEIWSNESNGSSIADFKSSKKMILLK